MDNLLSHAAVALQKTSTTVQSTPKIGLLDHLGFGNLGDDATLDAMMQNLKSRWPHAEFIALTMNPVDTRNRHGVPAYAIRRVWKMTMDAQQSAPRNAGFKAKFKRWVIRFPTLFVMLRTIKQTAIGMPKKFFQEVSFLAESFSIVRDLDLLVISGGGQLLDSWGGPWAFPYTLFKWVWLAKLAGVKCYFVNVGAGPLDNSLSKWFIRHALGVADYISFRDGHSQALVRQVGFRGRSEVSVDSVYSLDVSGCHSTSTGSRREPVIGLCPMAYCDPRRYWAKKQAVYEDYIQRLALFGAWLVRSQHRLEIFSTEISFDNDAIEDLRRATEEQLGAAGSEYIVVKPVNAFSDLTSAILSSDYIVTSRYHGVILAHLLNRPILALSPHHKVATLMNDLGLSEYCVDIRTFNLDFLANVFTRLVEHQDAIKAGMFDTARNYEKNLQNQFDRLFPPQLLQRRVELE